MNVSPTEFIQLLQSGKSERELNMKEDLSYDPKEYKDLVRKYGHSHQSAVDYLQTDYSNGFTICGKCGSFYNLGKGFTKRLSSGCLNCEGEDKHRCYHVNASPPSEGGFPARTMCVMFDDGMSYCKDKLQIEYFKELVSQ